MLRKYAYAEVLGVDHALVPMAKMAHRANFEYTPRRGFVYIRSRAISSRTNDNYDTFPADELRKAWRTFIGKPVFLNHHNDDIRRKRGVIIDAALHDDKGPDGTDDTWIEVLMEVDAKTFPKLAMALIKQEIERTSMGTDVLVSKCSYCGNEARTPDQYCPHVQRMKGQRLRRKNAETGAIEDVLVHEICSGLSFFENSLLVEEPADPTAFAYGLDVRGILFEDELMDRLSKAASFTKAAAGSFVIVSGLGTGKAWEVHVAGCKDLSMPKYRVTQQELVQADSGAAAVDAYLDDQMLDQGWTTDDFKVFPCAGGKSESNAGKVQCPAGMQKVQFDNSSFKPTCYACGISVKQTRNGTYVKHWAGPKLNEPDCPRTGQVCETSETNCLECGTRLNLYRGRPVPPHKRSSLTSIGGLSIEALVSVAEQTMERAGLAGKHIEVPVSNLPTDPDLVEYNKAIAPLAAWVDSIVGRHINFYASDYKLDSEGGGQAVTDGYNYIAVRPHTSEMTILHECAHILDRSQEGPGGHTESFVKILAGLYREHISAAAADQFLSIVDMDHKMARKTACNVLVNDLDNLDRWIMQRPGVLRQEREGMALVQFADGDQRMFLESELTYTDEFFGGKVAHKTAGFDLTCGNCGAQCVWLPNDLEYVCPRCGGSPIDDGENDDLEFEGHKTGAVELDELQRARFKGTSVDKDDDGYYCKTHRTRSESYPSPDEIPDSAIEFIESTGAKKMAGQEAIYCADGRWYPDMAVANLPAPMLGAIEPDNENTGLVFCYLYSADGDIADEMAIDGEGNAKRWVETNVRMASKTAAISEEVMNLMREMGITDQEQMLKLQNRVLEMQDDEEASIGSNFDRRASVDIGVPTEVRVPPEVETLRPPQCPVCDSDASWNADGRCDVCGYLPPPKPFRAPDTDVAGRADQSGGWFDPELTRATPFNMNPVQSNISTAKGQRPTQGVSMSGQSVASAARQRITADRALASENERLRNAVAARDAEITKLRGRTASKRTADVDNPAQPVSEPAAQAAAPVSDADATVDVESVGGVVAPPDLSVPGNVTTPGAELPASEAPSTDVEAPVSGGSEPEDSTTEVVPNADGDGQTPNAFGGDWSNPGASTIGPHASLDRRQAGKIAAAVRDRIWASVRLARLRIQSGIATENDDLTLGKQIEASTVTLEAIQAESSGLQAALRARPAPQRQGSRQATRAPSLAAGQQPSIVGLAARGTEDEMMFE